MHTLVENMQLLHDQAFTGSDFKAWIIGSKLRYISIGNHVNDSVKRQVEVVLMGLLSSAQ